MKSNRVSLVNQMSKTIIEIEFSILGISDTKNLVSPIGLFRGKFGKGIEHVARYFSRSPQRIDIGATLHRIGGIEIGAIKGIPHTHDEVILVTVS